MNMSNNRWSKNPKTCFFFLYPINIVYSVSFLQKMDNMGGKKAKKHKKNHTIYTILVCFLQ